MHNTVSCESLSLILHSHLELQIHQLCLLHFPQPIPSYIIYTVPITYTIKVISGPLPFFIITFGTIIHYNNAYLIPCKLEFSSSNLLIICLKFVYSLLFSVLHVSINTRILYILLYNVQRCWRSFIYHNCKYNIFKREKDYLIVNTI